MKSQEYVDQQLRDEAIGMAKRVFERTLVERYKNPRLNPRLGVIHPDELTDWIMDQCEAFLARVHYH